MIKFLFKEYFDSFLENVLYQRGERLEVMELVTIFLQFRGGQMEVRGGGEKCMDLIYF